MSSDFGPLILHGVDPPIGLTERLAQTVDDPRHPPYLAHRFWACPQVYETSGIAALLSRGE
jgi:hypothetical protein